MRGHLSVVVTLPGSPLLPPRALEVVRGVGQKRASRAGPCVRASPFGIRLHASAALTLNEVDIFPADELANRSHLEPCEEKVSVVSWGVDPELVVAFDRPDGKP